MLTGVRDSGIITLKYHPLAIQADGGTGRRKIMSVQKNITLQINHSMDKIIKDTHPPSPPGDCDINIQVASGWAVTGHYQNNILQAITLQKSISPEAK